MLPQDVCASKCDVLLGAGSRGGAIRGGGVMAEGGEGTAKAMQARVLLLFSGFSLSWSYDDAAAGRRRIGISPSDPMLDGRLAEEAPRPRRHGLRRTRALVPPPLTYVAQEVVRRGVRRGYDVTSLSRRGENPQAGDPVMDAVTWIAGDATDANTVKPLVGEADAVVHAVGLLFDVESGLDKLNLIVSGSGSTPSADSTYDRITRLTAFNAIDAAKAKLRFPFSPRTPFAFVSAAEAGWPDVQFGDIVEQRLAPEWLKKYLAAKRKVEAKLADASDTIRPVIFRPSLIWSWTKLDVLPIIPVFNAASAAGVPFVDRTVRVSTLADAIIAAIADDAIEGVQRFPEMDQLAAAGKST